MGNKVNGVEAMGGIMQRFLTLFSRHNPKSSKSLFSGSGTGLRFIYWGC